MEADEAELESVAAFVERLIAQCKHEEAAFWLGYLGGLKRHLSCGNPLIRPEDIHCLERIGLGQGEKNLAAYSRGYFAGFEGRSSGELLEESDRGSLGEIAKFRRINGCSVCKHSAYPEDDARPAADARKRFQCKRFKRMVDWKEGTTCPDWVCE